MEIKSKEIDNTFTVINSKGLRIKRGDYVYYNTISLELQIFTSCCEVKSFIIYNNKICILYNYNDITKPINVEDLYGSVDEAREVAEKWVQKSIRQELSAEVKSYLEKQKKKHLSTLE